MQLLIFTIARPGIIIRSRAGAPPGKKSSDIQSRYFAMCWATRIYSRYAVCAVHESQSNCWTN